MFAKLLFNIKVRNVVKGEYLYEKGEDSKYFYFVLRGKLELLVK